MNLRAASSCLPHRPRFHGSMKTSSTCGLPLSAVSRSDTCATPSDSADTTAEVVTVTGAGSQPTPPTAIPAGSTSFPAIRLTATEPFPAMKKRTDGSAASTQVAGDCADEPAGSVSDQLPCVPVAAKGSLPGTRRAPPLNVHAGFSKSPPGASSYEARSAQG